MLSLKILPAKAVIKVRHLSKYVKKKLNNQIVQRDSSDFSEVESWKLLVITITTAV